MVNLSIQLLIPYIEERFNNLWCGSWSVSKHKAVELEFIFFSRTLIEAGFHITTRRDHAGVDALLGFFGFTVHLHLYDTRHWNHETNKWEVYED
jgi:hypothetical protein